MRSGASVAVRRTTGRESFPQPAGFRLMIPGWPQWSWSQRDRASVLFGGYIAALAVGLFAWGTLPGALILGFAFGAHVFSAADALRQSAFPPFGRWLPWVSASAGLSLGYAPIFGVLWLVASPYPVDDRAERGFLINRWSYRQGRPRSGDWVGFVADGRRESRVGRLCGTEGQNVRWVDGKLTIDGQAVAWQSQHGSPRGRVSEYALAIPAGQVLIACEATNRGASDMVLVDRELVVGRAWAQHWPIWSRRFLRTEQP